MCWQSHLDTTRESDSRPECLASIAPYSSKQTAAMCNGNLVLSPSHLLDLWWDQDTNKDVGLQVCWPAGLGYFFFGYVKLTNYFYLWFLVQIRLCYWLLVYSILPPIFMLLWTATNKGLPGQSTEPIHVLPVSLCKVLWFLFPLVT